MVINLEDTNICLSLEDRSIIEDLSRILMQNNVKYSYVSPESLNDFIESAKEANVLNPWVLDHITFSKIWTTRHKNSLTAFPVIMVLLKEEELPFYKSKDLPENFSLLSSTLKGDSLLFFMESEFKRFKKRQKLVHNPVFYKKLFENSRQAKIILKGQDGKILTANEAAAGIYEKRLDELLQCNFRELHPEKSEILLSKITRVYNDTSDGQSLKVTLVKGLFKELELFFRKVETEKDSAVCVIIEDNTQKEKSDEMVYQQHEILRSTLESIDDLFFTLDKNGDFTEYFQPEGSTHLSISSDVFIGKNISEVGFPKEVSEKYLETIKHVIDQDKPEQIDYFIDAFGSRLWYNARISPRKGIFGMPEGVTVLCRDVTRQKKGEETIKRARDFYLTLLTDFPSMIWKANTSKRADYFNKTWLEFTGNDLETELHLDWVEKLHIKDVTGFLSILLKAYKNKESFQFEHRLKHKSGEYRWVYNVGSPFYNLDGHFSGFIGSCYDITERRKAEEMLNLQNSAMESALEGILIIAADEESCPVIYANSELSTITGISKEELIGMEFMKVLGKPLLPQTTLEIITSLKTKTSFKGEIQCVNEMDDTSWRLLNMSPVKDKENGITHFVAVLGDITDSKESENDLKIKNQELRKTNEELDRFVYSTSHELRSPLMSVLGLINLMESEDKALSENDINHNPDYITYLGMIRETISRLDKIIHDIIDYSRNSRLDIVYENIDFKTFIEKSIQNHQYLPQMKKIDFVIDINNKTPFFSDSRRMEIIFNNLISNCLKFHNYDQDRPFVEILVKTSPVNTLITINDNGTGIAESHLPKLYEMFYRGTEKSTGSGIGLYIVKEIVDKLKGNIQVHSALNKGTKFIIDLPNYFKKDELSSSDEAVNQQQI